MAMAPADDVLMASARSSTSIPSLPGTPGRPASRGTNGSLPGETIRVVCRFRPENNQEQEAGGEPCITLHEDEQSVTIRVEESSHTFKFTKVYPMWTPQEDLYEFSGAPLVADVMAGYNAAIIAYGQTGSGKTFTMQGPGFEDPRAHEFGLDEQLKGIIPRMMEDVFRRAAAAGTHVEFEIKASFIEIYNEKLRDLLRTEPPTTGNPLFLTAMERLKLERLTRLTIHASPDRGLWISNAIEVPVRNVWEVLQLMRLGALKRVTAETGSNKESSRSHAIFLVTVIKRNHLEHSTKVAQLYLVDLAGSEKVSKTQAEGVRLTEAQNINKSLLALGNVIQKLANGERHVPYRDSKLTRMLQNSFGGNSKTTLIINCSPSSFNARETLSTLKFGHRCTTIQNKPVVNEAKSVEELTALLSHERRENSRLREHVAALEMQLKQLKEQGVQATPTPAEAVPPAACPPPLPFIPQRPVWEKFELLAFLCPLTKQYLRDPVFATDGYTYERDAIERWMKTNSTSPMTNTTFATKQVYPNYSLRRLMALYFPAGSGARTLKRFLWFEVLPNELLLHIFSYCDAITLCRASQACTYWRDLLQDQHLWRDLIRKDFGELRVSAASVEGNLKLQYQALWRTHRSPHKTRPRASTVGVKLFLPS